MITFIAVLMSICSFANFQEVSKDEPLNHGQALLISIGFAGISLYLCLADGLMFILWRALEQNNCSLMIFTFRKITFIMSLASLVKSAYSGARHTTSLILKRRKQQFVTTILTTRVR